MPTLSPATFTIETGQTQQLTITGGSFAGTKWGVKSGVGSVDQTGLYSAGGAAGSAVVRLMFDIWQTIGAGLTYSPNNELVINNAGSYYEAKSYARLTAAGDQVDYKYSASFSPGIYDGGVLIQSFGGVLYYNGVSQHTLSPTPSVSDTISFVRIGSNQLGVKVNGTLKHTFSQTFSASLQPAVTIYVPTASVGAIFSAPIFSGTGITNYQEITASGTILVDLLTPREGCEIYVQADLVSGLSDNATVSSFTDQSGKGRHLTAASSQPIFKTNIINGKSVVRWDGTKNPLSNSTYITFRCGWMVAKFNGASFASYMGLLTGQNVVEVLKSNNSGTVFTPNGAPLFEYRLNDRIYPETEMEAPMNAFKVIFFRFWNSITIDGAQLGQNRNQTAQKWNGDVAFFTLYSNDFHEEDIRTHTQAIATNFGITLNSVYPYQGDISGHSETPEQTVNIYRPPEGEPIVEAVGDSKRVLKVRFSVSDQEETDQHLAIFNSHYPTQNSIIYRDYRFTPPRDIEVFIDEPYELDGSGNLFNYSVTFREK